MTEQQKREYQEAKDYGRISQEAAIHGMTTAKYIKKLKSPKDKKQERRRKWLLFTTAKKAQP